MKKVRLKPDTTYERGPAKEPVKKPLTAETAETAEKKMLRILGELCVLCGKTSHFFTGSKAGHYVRSTKVAISRSDFGPRDVALGVSVTGQAGCPTSDTARTVPRPARLCE